MYLLARAIGTCKWRNRCDLPCISPAGSSRKKAGRSFPFLGEDEHRTTSQLQVHAPQSRISRPVLSRSDTGTVRSPSLKRPRGFRLPRVTVPRHRNHTCKLSMSSSCLPPVLGARARLRAGVKPQVHECGQKPLVGRGTCQALGYKYEGRAREIRAGIHRRDTKFKEGP